MKRYKYRKVTDSYGVCYSHKRPDESWHIHFDSKQNAYVGFDPDRNRFVVESYISNRRAPMLPGGWRWRLALEAVQMTFRKIYWWFAHRVFPKYAYHKPKCSLTPGYYDPDTRIKNTIFEEISDYYDNAQVDWFWCEDHKLAGEAFKQARDWWREERPELQKKIDLLWDSEDIINHEIALSKESGMEEMDRKYLIEVIKYIDYAWYP